MSRPAKLPGLSPVATGNPALDNLLRQMIERMDVREGARGDPGEKVVTHKEMKALGLDADQIGAAGLSSNVVGGSRGGVMVQTPGGSFTRVPYDTFADELRKTALYRDLMASINSVNRFDGVPAEVRAILLSSLADEAAQWGAEIRRLDKKIQSETESLAYTVETITAAVSGAAAGVREVSFASATANAATAGRITQVTARLDDFSDGTAGTATIEQKMTATANRATGLEAQLTWKVGTNGAMAGIGLASTTSVAGVSTSAVIISAAKFALVGPSETIADPANPPLNRLPFGYDSATNTLFINGTVRINAGGTALQDAVGVPGATGARGSVTRYTTGAWNGTDSSYVSLFPGGAVVIGDTLTSSASSITRYWGGSSWVNPGVFINGNLLVGGNISSTSLDTSQYVRAEGTGTASGFATAGLFGYSGGAEYGVRGYGTSIGVYGEGYGNGSGVYGKGAGTGPGVTAVAGSGGTALFVNGRIDATVGNGGLAIYGQVNSTQPQGSPPFTVSSNTQVNSFNAQFVGGLRFGTGQAATPSGTSGYIPLHNTAGTVVAYVAAIFV